MRTVNSPTERLVASEKRLLLLTGPSTQEGRIGEPLPVVAHVDSTVPFEAEIVFDAEFFDLVVSERVLARAAGKHDLEWRLLPKRPAAVPLPIRLAARGAGLFQLSQISVRILGDG